LTLKESLVVITSQLKGLIDNPRREAYLFLMHHLNCDELYLMSHEDETLEDEKRLFDLVQRRTQNEPFEYLVQKVSFYSHEFYVDKRVLIARPETELLIDSIALHVKMDEVKNVVEVGVGSGIISIILALKFPHIHITALDISPDALAVAAINIEKFKLENQITLRQSDLLSAYNAPIDLLVSNPPYIANDADLESNLSYEPSLALFGGEIGDELVHKLLDEIKNRNIRYAAFEYGYDQRNSVSEYLNNDSVQSLEFYKDYAGFDRGFILERTI